MIVREAMKRKTRIPWDEQAPFTEIKDNTLAATRKSWTGAMPIVDDH